MPHSVAPTQSAVPTTRLRAEQTRQLYGGLPWILAVSTGVGTVLAGALWTPALTVEVLAWLAALVAVNGGRMGLVRLYERRSPGTEESRRWLALFMAGTLLAGLVWGAAGILLFPDDDPTRFAILAVGLAGVAAGAVTSLSAFWPAGLIFLGTSLIPFLARTLASDLPIALPVAALGALFLVVLAAMNGRIAGSVATNIRLRLEASEREEALLEYRTAFDQSRDAVMFQDHQHFRDCNAAALALFGVPDVATFRTLGPDDLSPAHQPDGTPSKQAARQRVEEAFRHGQAFFEWRSQTLAGEVFPSEVLLSRIQLPGQPVLQAVVRDISERQAFERALRRKEADLETAQRIGRVGNWTLDLTSGELQWSDEIYRIFGVSPQAFGATYEAFLKYVHPDDRPEIERRMEQALAGESYYDVEHRIRTADGEERVVHERGEVERGATGHPLRMLGTVLDITERAEAERALRQGIEQEATVQQISKQLLEATADEMDATLAAVLAQLGTVTGSDRCELFRISDHGRTLNKTHAWHAEGAAPPSPIRGRQGLATAELPWLIDRLRQQRVVSVTSLDEISDPDYRRTLANQGLCSLLFVPLVLDGEPAGFLGLASVQGTRDWSESEHHLLRITGDTLASALARWDLEHELRYRAEHDQLTGYLNRRHFDDLLEREVERAHRYGTPFSLAMFDLDRFKRINDTFGHAVGDRILQELTALVGTRLRSPDVLARWGGEEFMILLPETDLAGAEQLAEALRAQVAEASFAEAGQVTISLGVAQYAAGEAVKDLTKRVDDALYLAKKAGRDRVESRPAAE